MNQLAQLRLVTRYFSSVSVFVFFFACVTQPSAASETQIFYLSIKMNYYLFVKIIFVVVVPMGVILSLAFRGATIVSLPEMASRLSDVIA